MQLTLYNKMHKTQKQTVYIPMPLSYPQVLFFNNLLKVDGSQAT